jgi:hypothetical protein
LCEIFTARLKKTPSYERARSLRRAPPGRNAPRRRARTSSTNHAPVPGDRRYGA